MIILYGTSATQPIVWLSQTIQYTQAFNGPLSGTTRVTQYQKGKPIWIPLKQHNTSQFFTARMPFLLPNQQCQSTEGKKNNTICNCNSNHLQWYQENQLAARETYYPLGQRRSGHDLSAPSVDPDPRDLTDDPTDLCLQQSCLPPLPSAPTTRHS